MRAVAPYFSMVSWSDSLWSIAQQSGVSVDEILVANVALTSTSMIEMGMSIRLPEGVSIPDLNRTRHRSAALGPVA